MTDPDQPAGMMSPREGIVVLYRRRWWVLAPVLAGLLTAVAWVVLVPSAYRSSATLLITSQQIPTTVVASPLTNFADERIAKIRQQLLSRSNLTTLIAGTKLYRAERAALPLDDVLNVMRGAIGVDLVGTNAGAPPTAAAGSTIAFKLSFTYPDPQIARDVTEQLTAMFLAEDKRLRTEQAVGTAVFLDRRAVELRDQLVAIAGRRRAIEARYAGALPAQVAVSAQAGAALRAEVSRTDAESQGLQEQSSLLAVRGQEIAAAPGPGAAAVRSAEDRLTLLSATYADGYPDVVAARRALDRQRVAARATRGPRGGGLVATEIAASRARIGMLAGRRAQLVQSLSNIERLTSLAPQAAYELSNLDRDYETIRLQYQGIRDKQMDAQVAANLQTEDKGERFSVVDAPSLPTVPIGAGKVRTILFGIIAGLGLGLAATLIWEVLAGHVHGERGVISHMGAAPLTVVPLLAHGGAQAWWRRAWARLRRPLALRRAEAVA